EFFAHEARKPPIVPKIREISSALREPIRDSREFRANSPARLELQVLSLESEYHWQRNNRESQTLPCGDLLNEEVLPPFNFHRVFPQPLQSCQIRTLLKSV